MRGTSREEDEAGEEEGEKIEAGGSGGHSPQEGADATEELRHVARIRSSPNESLLKIFSDTREKRRAKKIRGRIGNVRKKERNGGKVLARSGFNLAIGTRRYHVATRRDAGRRSWSDFARATLFRDRRSVVRQSVKRLVSR